MKRENIRALRKRMGLNKSAFGRLFEVGGTQVDRWEKGDSSPPKKRLAQLQKLYDDEFNPKRVAEPSSNDYEKSGVIKEDAEKARGVSRDYYAKLSPKTRARVDVLVSKLIYGAWADEITDTREDE